MNVTEKPLHHSFTAETFLFTGFKSFHMVTHSHPPKRSLVLLLTLRTSCCSALLSLSFMQAKILAGDIGGSFSAKTLQPVQNSKEPSFYFFPQSNDTWKSFTQKNNKTNSNKISRFFAVDLGGRNTGSRIN